MKELFSHAAPVFQVPEVLTTAEWYRDKLGFTINFLWQEPPTYAVLRRSESVNLHLAQTEVALLGPLTPFYIFVRDVDALYDEFLERSAPLAERPQNTDYQMREFEISDPNGYKLVFGQNIEP